MFGWQLQKLRLKQFPKQESKLTVVDTISDIWPNFHAFIPVANLVHCTVLI